MTGTIQWARPFDTLAADRANGPLTLLRLLDTFEKVALERAADTITGETN